MSHYKMYINGKFVNSHSGKEMNLVNPATEEVFATAPEGTAHDAELAIKAARRAFDSGEWPALTHQARGRLLFKLAELVRREKSKLAKLETLNNGKPLREAEFDVDDAATKVECSLEISSGYAAFITSMTAGTSRCKVPARAAPAFSKWSLPSRMSFRIT